MLKKESNEEGCYWISSLWRISKKKGSETIYASKPLLPKYEDVQDKDSKYIFINATKLH